MTPEQMDKLREYATDEPDGTAAAALTRIGELIAVEDQRSRTIAKLQDERRSWRQAFVSLFADLMPYKLAWKNPVPEMYRYTVTDDELYNLGRYGGAMYTDGKIMWFSRSGKECSAYVHTVIQSLGDSTRESRAKAASLEHDVAILREALKWYADRKHYFTNAYHEPRITDLGDTARNALKRTNGRWLGRVSAEQLRFDRAVAAVIDAIWGSSEEFTATEELREAAAALDGKPRSRHA